MESHRHNKDGSTEAPSRKRKREKKAKSARPDVDSSVTTEQPAQGKSAPPKKKYKPKKEEDKTYRPGSTRPGNSDGNALHLRIKVTNQNEKIIALYYLENVSDIDQDEAAGHIRDAITIIRNGKPLDVRVVKRSATGTPTQVMTPDKHLYYLMKNYKSALFFSTVKPQPDNEPVTSLSKDNPLFQSDSYQNVKKTDAEQKQKTATLTQKQQREVAREKAKTGKRRPINQNQVMREGKIDPTLASATQYAQASGVFPSDQEFEWLHMIAYSLLGIISQSESNLVCGSFHANTDMMFTENQMKDFVKYYPDGFDVDVVAHMVEGTQIAHHIEFIFRTKHFTLPFLFDAQTNVQPHLDQEKYMKAFTSGVLYAANKPAQAEKDEENEEEEADKENRNPYETPERRASQKSIFLKKHPSARKTLQMGSPQADDTKNILKQRNK